MKLLFVNFAPTKLIEALSKRGYSIVTMARRGYRTINIFGEFDIVYYAKFAPPLLDDVPPYNIKSKAPIIYGLHAPLFIPHAWRTSNKVYNITSALKIPLFKFMKLYDAFHALNTNDYVVLKRLGFITYYIPLGVDTSLFKPDAKKEEFTVIFVSPRFQKGVDMLIKIVPTVLKKAPDIKFLLTGIGFLGNYFKALEDSFSSNIEVCERLPQDKFVKMFSSSHLLLFPSRWESFGLVVVEALSSGMPVVAFDIPGAPRDVLINGVTGGVVKPFDIRAMIEEVLKYYRIWERNPKEFARISDKCRRYALNFDWNIIADHFDKMFKAVVEEERK
jgi:glycosyltransferase involved in cell wall biosynthesis